MRRHFDHRSNAITLSNEQTILKSGFRRNWFQQSGWGLRIIYLVISAATTTRGKFTHVSMGGEENGSYSWYIVAPKTEEKVPDELSMLLQYDTPFE